MQCCPGKGPPKGFFPLAVCVHGLLSLLAQAACLSPVQSGLDSTYSK